MSFRAPWLPFALPQRWPFFWWVAVVIDHYSRRAMGFAVFRINPTSVSIQSFLESAIVNARAAPKYMMCDKSPQFWCDAFKAEFDAPGITPRFGAVGQHGSKSLVERCILTLKNECTRIILVPLSRDAIHQELTCFANWYNQSPSLVTERHDADEVYHDLFPACERPRCEPRERWPHSAPCASPQAPAAGHRGTPIRLDVRYHMGRTRLPIVDLRHAV